MRPMKGSKLVLPLLALGLGLSGRALAREFPNHNNQFKIPSAQPTYSPLWPLPKTMYPTGVNEGVTGLTGYVGYTARSSSLSSATTRVSKMSSGIMSGSGAATGLVLPQALRSVGMGSYKVRSLKGDPAALVPDLLGSMDSNFLVVRYEGDAYLMEFKTAAKRAKYVKRLRSVLNEAGLDIRHRTLQ